MRLAQCKAKVVLNKVANKLYITQPHHTHTPDYAQFCNVNDQQEREYYVETSET